jgi:hypothetical protein
LDHLRLLLLHGPRLRGMLYVNFSPPSRFVFAEDAGDQHHEQEAYDCPDHSDSTDHSTSVI